LRGGFIPHIVLRISMLQSTRMPQVGSDQSTSGAHSEIASRRCVASPIMGRSTSAELTAFSSARRESGVPAAEYSKTSQLKGYLLPIPGYRLSNTRNEQRHGKTAFEAHALAPHFSCPLEADVPSAPSRSYMALHGSSGFPATLVIDTPYSDSKSAASS
jgi:hypothetical protein